MKEVITWKRFRQLFHEAGKEGDFSFAGLRALFDYLEEMERDEDIEITPCPYALSEEFNEDSYEGAMESYNFTRIEELESATTVIFINDEDLIYQKF